MAWLTLFAAAFLSATIVPFYSEIYLVTLQGRGYDPYLLLVVATSGNTLGAAVNWGLGRYLLHYRDRRWFPFKEKQLNQAQNWFQKFGVWSLLLAWMPVGGDALTFIAGLMRVNFVVFFVLTFFGKAMRYIAVLFFAGQFFH